VAIKLPAKWYTDVSLNSFEKKLTKLFFKLTEVDQDYGCIISKQLIVTQDKNDLPIIYYYTFYKLMWWLNLSHFYIKSS